MKKINFITLGCSKNLVDTEHIMRQIDGQSYEVVHESDDKDARIVVINTCGFIGDAKEESIDMILRFAEAKKEGLIDKLFVMGCLSQRYREELEAEIPEIDALFGARSLKEVVEGLDAEYKTELEDERKVTTPTHYAYLKISEGCDRGCSYCAIPSIRGKHISIPMETLVSEANKLAQKGVKELLVIAQDTTYYGIDLYGKRMIAELLGQLCKVEGIEWIRVHYTYPSQFPIELIETIKNEPKICKYIDIPLQHISDNQLRLMRRNTTKAKTVELISKLRELIPEIAIRTTFIVGHCHESDEEYKELVDFLKWAKFERVGVFPYSEEEHTHSAEKLCDDVPQEVKNQRAEELMALQQQISLENNNQLIGQELRVIIDRKEDDLYVGRSQYDSPEVDQEIYITPSRELRIGEFITVKITSTDSYELYGKQVNI
ncbi:MAG: 30S ribosomal protein S12 methylthiotransferase RimO [Rikenellaceae bacterium]